MPIKVSDLLFVAAGGAAIWALWPKSRGGGITVPPQTGTASGGGYTTRTTPTAASSAPTAESYAPSTEYEPSYYEQQAQLDPDALYQSILTQGLNGYGDFGYQCGTSILSACLPSDMRSAALDLDQQIRATMVDVDTNRSMIPPGVAAGWDAFVNEWEHWTQQDQGSGQGWLYGAGVGNWWEAANVSMSAINGRLATLIDWRTKIRSYLGGLSSPDPAPPPPSSDPFVGILKAIPWIVGGVAAVVVLPRVLDFVPKGKG